MVCVDGHFGSLNDYCLGPFPQSSTICHYFFLPHLPDATAQKVTNLSSKRKFYLYEAFHHKLNHKQIAEEINMQII